MIFQVTQKLNRSLQLAVSAAETGNSVLVANFKIDPSQQLEIYGVDWGYSILASADQGTFLQGLCAGYLDFPLDLTVATFFSRSNPLDSGELFHVDIIGSEANYFYHRDYATPLSIEGSRQVTFVVVQPLFSAAQAGSLIMYLRVRGNYTANQLMKIGDWQAR